MYAKMHNKTVSNFVSESSKCKTTVKFSNHKLLKGLEAHIHSKTLN